MAQPTTVYNITNLSNLEVEKLAKKIRDDQRKKEGRTKRLTHERPEKKSNPLPSNYRGGYDLWTGERCYWNFDYPRLWAIFAEINHIKIENEDNIVALRQYVSENRARHKMRPTRALNKEQNHYIHWAQRMFYALLTVKRRIGRNFIYELPLDSSLPRDFIYEIRPPEAIADGLKQAEEESMKRYEEI